MSINREIWKNISAENKYQPYMQYQMYQDYYSNPWSALSFMRTFREHTSPTHFARAVLQVGGISTTFKH